MDDDDKKAGFLMGITAGYLALAEVLVRHGVLNAKELAKELDGLKEQFSAEHPSAADWIEATIQNLVRNDEE